MGKRKYHHEDLRTVLIQAATTILEDEGLENLTMRSMGKRVGVSRSAPYRHFQDKASLLGAVATDGFQRLSDSLPVISDSSCDPLDLFRGSCRAYVRFATGSPAIYRLMFGLEMSGGGSEPDLMEAAQGAFAVFVDVIGRCQEAGCFRTGDPMEPVNVTWAMLHGLSMLLIEGTIRMTDDGGHLHTLLAGNGGRPAEDIDTLATNVIDTLIRGFGADPA